MALMLYRSAYRNIKRTTKRHTPASRYYLVFDYRDPETGRKKKIREPLGQMSPEEARDRGVRLMAEFRSRPSEPIEGNLLSEIMEKHLAHATTYASTRRRRRLRPKSVQSYRTSDKILLAYFGDVPIDSLQREQILDFIFERQKTVSDLSINRDLARLRVLFRWAHEEWGYENPMTRVRNLPEGEGRRRYLLPEEIDRLWAVSSRWLWRIIWFAANSGLRQGEQFGLRWSQIVEGQIRLGEETKGGRSRTIPLIPDLQEILDEVKGDHPDLVFVTSAKKVRIHPSNFGRDHWRPALRAAQIEDFRWHDLRHTFCSWVVQGGGTLESLQELAGHASYATTKRYAHLAPEHLTSTMNILQGRWRHPEATPIRSSSRRHGVRGLKSS